MANAYDDIMAAIRTNTAVPAPKTQKTKEPKEAPTCKYFLQGGCKFGDKCRYKHPAKRGRSPDRGAKQSPNRKNRRTDRSSSKKPTARFSTLK